MEPDAYVYDSCAPVKIYKSDFVTELISSVYSMLGPEYILQGKRDREESTFSTEKTNANLRSVKHIVVTKREI